jgi:hypothetical protein
MVGESIDGVDGALQLPAAPANVAQQIGKQCIRDEGDALFRAEDNVDVGMSE